MVEFFNPSGIVAPASRYSQGAVHRMPARRLLISGQVGVRPDGTLSHDLGVQMETCFANLLAVLAAAAMAPTDLIKITAFVVPPGGVSLFRQLREKHLLGHAPTCTYLQVAGLASPDFLVEIEGEAIQEITP